MKKHQLYSSSIFYKRSTEITCTLAIVWFMSTQEWLRKYTKNMKLAVQDILLPFFDIIIIVQPITLISNSGWYFFALLNELIWHLVTDAILADIYGKKIA